MRRRNFLQASGFLPFLGSGLFNQRPQQTRNSSPEQHQASVKDFFINRMVHGLPTLSRCMQTEHFSFFICSTGETARYMEKERRGTASPQQTS